MSRTVVITGGHGALGSAIAEAFRAAGWCVHAPGRAELDVQDAATVAAWFSARGRLDLLVNNAGVRADAPCLTLKEADWDRVLGTCLRGAFLCARAAIPWLTQSGHIVNIGSFSALAGVAGQAAYCAAKAGLIGLTQSLAAEIGPQGKRVNCVLPGWMDTPFTADVPPPGRQQAVDRHVLGKLSTPADCARFLLTLQDMPAVSGQTFQLDSRISPW